MPFSELYCRAADGSNLNAGSTNTAAASLTYVSGSWVSTTRVFTVASGNPVTDGIAVDDLVSVYADGSTVTGFVGFVTARTTTTITIHATRSSGASPADGTSNRTLKKGGAWKGPNGADPFPYGTFLAAAVMINAAGEPVRVNHVGTFNITANINHTLAGPLMIQGCTSVAGDGGKATLDGGTTGASYILWSAAFAAAPTEFYDFIFCNNGATGGATGMSSSGAGKYVFERCVFHHFRGHGLKLAPGCIVRRCEFYGCNQANAGNAALVLDGAVTGTIDRCFIHDNVGSQSRGIILSSTAYVEVVDCIMESNGNAGMEISGAGGLIKNCDFYNNGVDGVRVNNNSAYTGVWMENCNFIKNIGWGVNGSGIAWRAGYIRNCGFGSGSQANTSGTITNPKNVVESGSIVYPSGVTPWVDPVNGNFCVNLAEAKNKGDATFMQTVPGHEGTVGYPDLGAAQHQETGSGGGRNPLAKTIIVVL